MRLFRIDNQLSRLREKPFKTEKELQTLTEQNLGAVFGLQFISSEFTVGSFRLDTVAFDQESQSFVIIEYKKTKNFSVVDQGYAYLSAMLNNKADFILEYNETQSGQLRKNTVDWSQSRILFVSPAFTSYQQEAINFRNMPIELWHIRRFENNTVAYEQIGQQGTQESLPEVAPPDTAAEEIEVYTEESNLANAKVETRELYIRLKEALFALGEFEIRPRKLYLSFLLEDRIICDINIQQKALKMWINLKAGQLDDGLGLARDVSGKGHWGNGDYEIQIRDDERLEYIVSLVKQSIQSHGDSA